MPVKVWAPYERLTAGDLNAAFAEVSAGMLPGVIASVGTALQITTLNVATEVSAGDPIAGNDSGGYWNPTTNRAGPPAGMGGIHLAIVHISVDAGSADNHKGRLHISGIGGPNTTQSFTRMTAGVQTYAHLSIVGQVNQGGLIYPMVTLYTSAGWVQVYGFTVIRLGTFGAYAALMDVLEDRAEDATLPDATLPQGEGASLAAEGEQPPKVTPPP